MELNVLNTKLIKFYIDGHNYYETASQKYPTV